ncbi:uncharacterized protein B0H18DRAFT_1124341 [Fomitopsis serialis]|uniref:uncharacterized protein n=1 Tax=Fomitopsis serialis TaxID=139415 RepID=UPI0020081ABD|nr:uncharacterized protein B0H18DRAFT_1124341 [Neoantrodia serialis]KAH9916202.1 hypothetical protein B0H18DRAFT_1124341 [Neoantrodia serialis]
MSSGDHKFPSPIGGIPFPHDFAPALFFTILYAITAPVGIYRMVNKRSRTLMILGTVIFSVERIADFAIRAAEAEKPNIRTTKFFVGWLQSAYGMGFLSTTQDLNNLARLFVMKTTEGTSFPVGIPPVGRTASRMEEEQPLAAMGGFEDEPARRALLRRTGIATLVLRLLAVALAGVSGGLYYNGIASESQASLVQHTRYASTIIVLFLQFFGLSEVLWALAARPKRTPRGPALYICSMICIIVSLHDDHHRVSPDSDVQLHRLADVDGPGSLNGPTAKALFYAFHIAPEWLSGAMLLGVNVKDTFGLSGA